MKIENFLHKVKVYRIRKNIATTISIANVTSIALKLWRTSSMEHMIPHDKIKHNRKSMDLLTSWKQTGKFVHDYISNSY